MSHGYSRSTRFRHMKASRPTIPVERVSFHKTEEPTDMTNTTVLGKISETITKSAAARAEGRISDADVAKIHQELALELYPDSKNNGVALQKFYDTELGKQALKVATSMQHMALQESVRSGDADEFILKNRQSQEVSNSAPEHYDPKGKKGSRKPKHRNPGDNLDNDDEDTSKSHAANAASYCHALALEHSAREGCSVDKSYGALLGGDEYFRQIWRLATKPLSA